MHLVEMVSVFANSSCLSTTTVVMEERKNVDETGVGAPVDGNGFGGPRAAFFVEK